MDRDYIRNALRPPKPPFFSPPEHVEWLVFTATTADAACRALGAQRTGQYGKPLSHDLMGSALPGGMYLVLADSNHLGLSSRFPAMAKLDQDLLAFTWDGDFGVSTLEAWLDGRQVWGFCSPFEGSSFEVDGPVPEPFSDIRARLEARQQEAWDNAEGVNYLEDVAVELGEVLTGYRVDRAPGPSLRFEALAMSRKTWREARRSAGRAATTAGPGSTAGAVSRPWWKFW